MRQLLAVVGALVVTGSASAQYPPTPPGPGAIFVQNIAKHPTAGGYFMSKAAYGDAYTNNAAGSVHSDFAFVMGSSRSFFAPCGPFIGGPYVPCFQGRKPAAAACQPCEGK